MEQLKIGWGIRDFTLDKPAHMYGQMHLRPSEGVLSPLMVTALCLDGGEGQDCVIFLGCDIECPLGDIIEPICEAVHAKHPEIPLHAIVLGGTHTHTCMTFRDTPEKTPDGREIFPGSESRNYFIGRAAEAACEAWENRRPGGIAYGYGYAVVGHSRRVVYFDDFSLRKPNAIAPNGHAVMNGRTSDPLFSHYETGVSHMVDAMYTVDETGKLTGILANVPCPSQVYGSMIWQSADFWHDVREGVKKEFGEDVHVLNQSAAGGDACPFLLHYLNAQRRRMRLKYGLDYDLALDKGKGHDRRPGDERYKRCIAECMDITERIMDALTEIWGWAKNDIRTEVPVGHDYRIIDLPRRMVTEAERERSEKVLAELHYPTLEECGNDPDEYSFRFSMQSSVESRNRLCLQHYKEQQTQPCVPMKMHVVRVGDAAFVTSRFEVFTDFQLRLQARSPFVQTFLVQLAGDEDEGYLATERAIENKGYSASVFCNPVSAEGGQVWVEDALAILNEMKSHDNVTN